MPIDEVKGEPCWTYKEESWHEWQKVWPAGRKNSIDALKASREIEVDTEELKLQTVREITWA